MSSLAQQNAESLQSFPVTRTTSDARDNVEKLRSVLGGAVTRFTFATGYALGYEGTSALVITDTATALPAYTIS